MQIEAQISIDAPPTRVFDCYADVKNWHLWDPDTAQASLDGAFCTGATGVLKPSQGFAVPMRFVAVNRPHAFTVESRVILGLLRFEHILTPEGQGTRALHRVVFSGPLGRFYYWLLGPRVRRGLPVTMHSLKAHIEDARK